MPFFLPFLVKGAVKAAKLAKVAKAAKAAKAVAKSAVKSEVKNAVVEAPVPSVPKPRRRRRGRVRIVGAGVSDVPYGVYEKTMGDMDEANDIDTQEQDQEGLIGGVYENSKGNRDVDEANDIDGQDYDQEQLIGGAKGDEDFDLGSHLSKHIMEQHGGARHRKFLHGMLHHSHHSGAYEGGSVGQYDGAGYGTVHSHDADGWAGVKVGRHSATALANRRAMEIQKERENPIGSWRGVQATVSRGGAKPKKEAESKSDEGELKNKGGKKPRPAMLPGDGRRRRADIVKKVMADKGLKMIAASKYVKEHGLYK